MMGDEAAARKSYETFLDLWKNADPDIPIYQQAKPSTPNSKTRVARRDDYSTSIRRALQEA
jgi:hypothetical protein